MRSKITVIGAPSVVEDLREGDYADVVGADGLIGADLVVLGPEADVAAEAKRAASRASGCVVVVVDGDPGAAYKASLFTRGRVVGVPAERVREVAQAVLLDRRVTLEVTMVGLDDEVATVRGVVGAGGVRQLA